jgi:hypothetical protein
MILVTPRFLFYLVAVSLALGMILGIYLTMRGMG